MPHIIFEIPEQLSTNWDIQQLLHNLHTAAGEVPTVDINDLKSRIHILKHSATGTMAADSGSFIYVKLIQTKPRPLEYQQQLRQVVLDTICAYVKAHTKEKTQICLENIQAPAGSYTKVVI